jgi:hypothetical protein
MPTLALRFVAIAMLIIITAAAFVDPAATPALGTYSATVKVICGALAIVGSMCLMRAISLTLLRSGGIVTFRAAYVSAAALGGLGIAEALSVLWPVNIGHALAVYCIVSASSGMLWVRFYGHAA